MHYKSILHMKHIVPVLSACCIAILSGCGPAEKDATGKIKLGFSAVKDKPIKVYYSFSVTSVSAKAVTTFNMELSGKGETDANGNTTVQFRNDAISMEGIVNGEIASAKAGSTDTLTGELRLVAMPVFSLLGKTYQVVYSPQLDKKSEIQVNGTEIVDSTENKMQFYVRYPDHEVGVGDTWQKELLIKAGNKMNCSATYTLKEIKGDSAVIAIQGKLYGKGESFGNEFSIDGKLNGTFTVDVQTGWPLSTRIDEEFSLKMEDKDLPMTYSIRSKVE